VPLEADKHKKEKMTGKPKPRKRGVKKRKENY